MLLKITAATAALVAAAAVAGAASAQDQSSYAGTTANPTGSVQTDASGSASAAATSAPASANGYNVGTPQVDPNTGAQIVTNGPIPDTRANRARFGQPDSHAGRRTAPAGN